MLLQLLQALGVFAVLVALGGACRTLFTVAGILFFARLALVQILRAVYELTRLSLCVPLSALRAVEAKALRDRLDAATGGSVPVATQLILLLELPQTLASWLLYHRFRAFFLPLLHASQEAKAGRELPAAGAKSQWRSALRDSYDLSGDEKRIGHTTLACLCIGPRWNTHTNVVTFVLQLPEKRAGLVELENVVLPAYSWQCVLYEGAVGWKTVASCTAMPGSGQQWVGVHVDLGPGSDRILRLMLRPYIYGDVPADETRPIPRVRLDGVDISEAEPLRVARSHTAFNDRLRSMQTAFHAALQWHVYPILCARNLLPADFVRRMYLPVGNPETAWLFGVVRKGYALSFKVAPAVLDDHMVLCSVYSRASIPTAAGVEVLTPSTTLAVNEEDGFWAVRIVTKSGTTTAPAVASGVEVALTKGLAHAPTPTRAKRD